MLDVHLERERYYRKIHFNVFVSDETKKKSFTVTINELSLRKIVLVLLNMSNMRKTHYR